MPDAARSGEKIFRGIPVSPGVCRGKILVLGKPHSEGIPRIEIPEGEISGEIKRFEKLLRFRHDSDPENSQEGLSAISR